MELLKTLERAGFNLRSDGKRVTARRTSKTQMSAQAAAPLLKALEQHQDEAVAALKPAPIDPIGDMERAITSGTLSPIDEAIAIHEYAYARGHRMCSDGTTVAGNIRELKRVKGGQA